MFNVPPNTLQVISGTGFYGSNDPTNSVKALNEMKLMTHSSRCPS